MAESVYKVVELIGTSPESWEKAARVAVETAAEALRDLRIAEVVEQDLQIEEGKVIAYRVKVKLSLKYERTAARAWASGAQSAPTPRPSGQMGNVSSSWQSSPSGHDSALSTSRT
jgi:flavin-binding protein dodecin